MPQKNKVLFVDDTKTTPNDVVKKVKEILGR